MKKWLKLVVIVCLGLSLFGCGKEESNDSVTNIIIHKDGKITHTICEDFGESYYSIEGLSAMIEETIQVYRKENPEAEIELKKCEISDGENAVVVMEYGSYREYSDFNSKELFVGTIRQAYEAGMDLNYYMTSVAGKNVETITKQELLNMGEDMIVICEENLEMSLPGNILYKSDMAELIGKKKVMMKQEQGLSAVVFK